MSVNAVVVSGEVSSYGPKIAWTPAGKPQTSFTMVVRKGEYKTFIPIICVGGKAEEVAERLDPGDLCLVQGSLSWKAGKTKDAGRLQVACFEVEVLAKATASASQN